MRRKPSLPMSVINPDHLLDQAANLVAPSAAGAPRQVDLRRAISNAYYSVFHAIATSLADQFVGVAKRNTSQYGLVYRTLEHRALARLCEDLNKRNPPAKFAPHLPANGFAPNLTSFFAAVKDLQEKRHSADYDPAIKFHIAEAALAISTARSAIGRFQAAPDAERLAFLSLLAFDPRH